MAKIAFYLLCAEFLVIQTVYSRGCGRALNQGSNYRKSLGGFTGSNVGYGDGNSYGRSLGPVFFGSVGSNIGHGSLGTYGSYGLSGSKFGGNSVSSGSNIVGVGSGLGLGSSGSGNGGFGATGTGLLAIEGAVPVSGNTYVDGNLPILGLVEFTGNLPASGVVSVSGYTPCQCSQYPFGY